MTTWARGAGPGRSPALMATNVAGRTAPSFSSMSACRTVPASARPALPDAQGGAFEHFGEQCLLRHFSFVFAKHIEEQLGADLGRLGGVEAEKCHLVEPRRRLCGWFRHRRSCSLRSHFPPPRGLAFVPFHESLFTRFRGGMGRRAKRESDVSHFEFAARPMPLAERRGWFSRKWRRAGEARFAR